MTRSLAARAVDHVETETAFLENDPAFDLAASTQTKARLLAELRRSDTAHVGTTDEVKHLRDALARNGAELAAQLAAVREIAAIIMETVRDDASDGTYRSGSRTGRVLSDATVRTEAAWARFSISCCAARRPSAAIMRSA